MSWKDEIMKTNIRKGDYSIKWESIEIDDLVLKNKPKELINMDAGFDTVDVTAGEATVKGAFEVDVRTWGIKSLYSYATNITFVMTFEDTETDLYEDIDVEIDFTGSGMEDDHINTENEQINPAYIHVEIDMRESKNSSQFETKATIYWQGTY